MIENVLLYLLGGLVVSNLIVIWFMSNISIHVYDISTIFKKEKKKLYTRNDWETHAALNWGYLGELFMCPLCLATHLSWMTGLSIYYISGCSPWMILGETFSWPLISYIFLEKISK
jgi:hypothetical protein